MRYVIDFVTPYGTVLPRLAAAEGLLLFGVKYHLNDVSVCKNNNFGKKHPAQGRFLY